MNEKHLFPDGHKNIGMFYSDLYKHYWFDILMRLYLTASENNILEIM